MILDFLLAGIGTVISCGGIRFRRFFSGLIGLLTSLLATIITCLLLQVQLKGALLGIALLFMLASTILSAIYYKVCAAINSFLSVFGTVLLLFGLSRIASYGNEGMGVAGMMIVAVLLGLLVMAISVKFYDVSFLVITAFVGALIASPGYCGIIKWKDLNFVLNDVMSFQSECMGWIVAFTVALTVIGVIVQRRRLNIIRDEVRRGIRKESGYKIKPDSKFGKLVEAFKDVLKAEWKFVVASLILHLILPQVGSVITAAMIIYLELRKEKPKNTFIFILCAEIITIIPNFVGMLLLWMVCTFINQKVEQNEKKPLVMLAALAALGAVWYIATGAFGFWFLYLFALLAATYLLLKMRGNYDLLAFNKPQPEATLFAQAETEEADTNTAQQQSKEM